MRGKILLVLGLGVGYVLGARAGRERYNEIARAASKFWNDPRLQKQVHQAEQFVKDKAPEVAEFVSDGARNLVSQVNGTKKAAAKPAAKTPAKPAARKSPTTGSAATKK